MRRPRMSKYLSELTSVHEEVSEEEDSASAIELRRQHILESMAKLEGRPTDSSNPSGIQKGTPNPKTRAVPLGHQFGFLPHPHPQQLPMPVPAPFFYYYPSAPAHMLYAQPHLQHHLIQNIHAFPMPRADPSTMTSAEAARLPTNHQDLTKVNQRSLSTPGPPPSHFPSEHANALIGSPYFPQSKPLTRSMGVAPPGIRLHDQTNFEQRAPQLSPYQGQRYCDCTVASNTDPNRVTTSYAFQPCSCESEKRLIEKKKMSVAEINLLGTLPPKPPILAEKLQKVDKKRGSRKAEKDEFSWFDY